ncbi:MAG: EF-hand domain-containing protein [Lysobacterales bacterium]
MSNFNKRITQGLVTVFAGCVLGLVAQADEGYRHGPVPFAEFDMDGNGSISESEFYSVREQRMAAMASEGRKMRCAADAPTFADIDTNGDGQLNPEELVAGQKSHMEKCRAMGPGEGMGGKHHMPVFANIDVDSDGMISASELNAAHAKRMSEMAAQGHKMKHADDMPDFSSIDSNGDGGISEQEFSDHLSAHHKQMQQNSQKQD